MHRHSGRGSVGQNSGQPEAGRPLYARRRWLQRAGLVALGAVSAPWLTACQPVPPAPLRYWRGPVWQHMNLLFETGLRECGHTALADRVRASSQALFDSAGYARHLEAAFAEAHRRRAGSRGRRRPPAHPQDAARRADRLHLARLWRDSAGGMGRHAREAGPSGAQGAERPPCARPTATTSRLLPSKAFMRTMPPMPTSL